MKAFTIFVKWYVTPFVAKWVYCHKVNKPNDKPHYKMRGMNTEELFQPQHIHHPLTSSHNIQQKSGTWIPVNMYLLEITKPQDFTESHLYVWVEAQ